VKVRVTGRAFMMNRGREPENPGHSPGLAIAREHGYSGWPRLDPAPAGPGPGRRADRGRAAAAGGRARTDPSMISFGLIPLAAAAAAFATYCRTRRG